jgi:hypothetical protein
MTTDNKLNLILDKQIPDYVQEYYPLFVVFLSKYFEWLDQGGNPQAVLQDLQLYRDVDSTNSSLTTKFYTTYLPNLPQNYYADPALLVKYFRDFYETKGSERSFKFFFKAFFNDDIEVRRPRETVFKLSDSVWVRQQYLRVTSDGLSPQRLIGSIIVGSSSGARAAVNTVISVAAGRVYDLLLVKDSVTGTFSSSETIVGSYFDIANDTSVTVTATNTLPLQTAQGRALNSRSQLSSDQVLQDNYYYQNFSYVVRSRINLDEWQQAVLSQLHPTGHAFFNERVIDVPNITVTSNFVRNNVLTTTVNFAENKDFYIDSGYTFDRLADFRTGTSATTSIGAIVYDAGFSYQGENVTWALQKGGDNTVYGYSEITGTTSYLTSFTITSFTDVQISEATVTSVASGLGTSYSVVVNDGINHAESFFFDGDLTTSVVTFFGFSRVEFVGFGPTFDKVGAGVAVREQIVLDGLNIDSSLVTQYLHTTSNLSLSASTLVASGGIYDATSCLLVITWMKDPSGNASSEATNVLTLTVSSTAGMYIYYDEETQRNYRSLALGNSLAYPDLSYYNSSNTLVNISSHAHGDLLTGGSTATWNFTPFNVNRSQSYSRAVIRLVAGGLGSTFDFGLRVSSGAATFNALAEDHLNVTVVGAAP